MFNQLHTVHRGFFKALAIAVAIVSGLIPLAAHAGSPGSAPPGSIGINFNLQGQVQNTVYAATGSGVVNDNGDLQLTVNITQPEQHTLQEVVSNGAVYLSMDGAPYQSFDIGQALSGNLPSGGCQAPSEAGGLGGGLQSLLSTGGGLGAGRLLQPVGQATVDGVTTEHLAGQIDLSSIAPQLGSLLGQTFAACGLPGNLVSSANVSQALSGATLGLDVYLEQPGNFPRRISYTLNVPAKSLQLAFDETLTPSDMSVSIQAPGS